MHLNNSDFLCINVKYVLCDSDNLLNLIVFFLSKVLLQYFGFCFESPNMLLKNSVKLLFWNLLLLLMFHLLNHLVVQSLCTCGDIMLKPNVPIDAMISNMLWYHLYFMFLKSTNGTQFLTCEKHQILL